MKSITELYSSYVCFISSFKDFSKEFRNICLFCTCRSVADIVHQTSTRCTLSDCRTLFSWNCICEASTFHTFLPVSATFRPVYHIRCVMSERNDLIQWKRTDTHLVSCTMYTKHVHQQILLWWIIEQPDSHLKVHCILTYSNLKPWLWDCISYQNIQKEVPTIIKCMWNVSYLIHSP